MFSLAYTSWSKFLIHDFDITENITLCYSLSILGEWGAVSNILSSLWRVRLGFWFTLSKVSQLSTSKAATLVGLQVKLNWFGKVAQYRWHIVHCAISGKKHALNPPTKCFDLFPKQSVSVER